MSGIIERVIAVPEASVGGLLKQVWSDFGARHLSLKQRFLDRFDELEELLPAGAAISEQRRLLIGSYFLLEYSLESAALFSPSMVPHPDQSGLPSGALRFILSLRATGEGHISSITFRSGIVHDDMRIELDPAGTCSPNHGRLPTRCMKARYFSESSGNSAWKATLLAGSYKDWEPRSRCRRCATPWLPSCNAPASAWRSGKTS